jgi:hypothetical protein
MSNGSATLHRAVALNAMNTMNFWRSDNGVYGLVAVRAQEEA